MRNWIATIITAVALSACKAPPPSAPAAPSSPAATAVPSPAPTYPPVQPLPPGTPGALPDDRTPISEAPFTPASAQGAADVVQRYFALVESARYDQAWALWSDGGKAGAPTAADFAKPFADYIDYHGLVGAPGQMEGAAGSSYVEVPIQVYGRRKDGREVQEGGSVTLRRVNDVPGSTAEQRLWHITAIALKPIG